MMTDYEDHDDLPTHSCVSAGHVQSKLQPRSQSQTQPAQSPILRSQSHSTSRTLVRRVVAALVIVMLAGSAVLLGCLSAYAWYRRALADCVEWGTTYRLIDAHVEALANQADELAARDAAESRTANSETRETQRLRTVVAEASKQRRQADAAVHAITDIRVSCAAKQSPVALHEHVEAFRDASNRLRPEIGRILGALEPVAARVLEHDPQAKAAAVNRIRAVMPGMHALYRDTPGLRDAGTGRGLRDALTQAASAADNPDSTYRTLADAEHTLFAKADEFIRARNTQRGIDCGRMACVALTFDDGPRADITRRVVQSLRDKGDRATFFAVGGAINDATIPVLRDDTRYGMPVGSHTMSHTDLPAIMQAGTERQEFDDASARISEATGRPVNLLRPPHGAADEESRRYLADHLGVGIALYDVDSYDWAAGASARSVQWKVTAQTRPGSIILMHDIHEHTATALPHILDALHAKGFRTVTIDELTGQYPRPGYVYYSRDNIVPW